MVDHPHVTYNVDHQSVSVEPDANGNFHKVHRVHYTSPSGVKSHVDVPSHSFTANNVHNAIQDEMERVEQVAALQPGTPVPPPEVMP